MKIRQILFWIFFVGTLSYVWRLLDLPEETAIKNSLTDFIAIYGVSFVLVGSFLESLLLIGLYFPGSLIIFLAVGSAPDSHTAFLMILAVSLGMFLGYFVDYILGRYGWYRILIRLGLEKQLLVAEQSLKKYDVRYFLATYWNPGLASFSATSAGVIRLSWRRFLTLSLLCIICWNTFWGLLVYSLGDKAISLISTKTVLSVLGLLLILELIRLGYRRMIVK